MGLAEQLALLAKGDVAVPEPEEWEVQEEQLAMPFEAAAWQSWLWTTTVHVGVGVGPSHVGGRGDVVIVAAAAAAAASRAGAGATCCSTACAVTTCPVAIPVAASALRRPHRGRQQQ